MNSIKLAQLTRIAPRASDPARLAIAAFGKSLIFKAPNPQLRASFAINVIKAAGAVKANIRHGVFVNIATPEMTAAIRTNELSKAALNQTDNELKAIRS